MVLCMPEPAVSLSLTSIAERKLASSHIIKLPWALTMKRSSIAKDGLLPTTYRAVEMEKGKEMAKSEFAHLQREI